MYTTLIEPSELAEHTADPNWVVVDCRFDLTRPDWGASAYAQGHVPNALYAHLDRDLSGPVTSTSGRHPLPSVEAFVATLSRWGVDENAQVIAYDQNNGAYASRLWWLLRWLGHERVAVLNGGFAAWQQAGLPFQAGLPAEAGMPVSQQPGVRQARHFAARPARGADVSTVELETLLAAGQLAARTRTLVDARGPDRFAGQNETIDPIAGHVPGAINYPFARNLDAQGRFLSAQVLRSQWLDTLQGQSPSEVIAMCGSGVTACHNLLALETAGLTGAKLYAGSWSEWIRDAARPIAQ